MASAQVLPKELRLAAPPTMPRARSYLFKQQATQNTYNFGQTIQINIPRLQRSYLTKDSYLKFAVQYTCTATPDGTTATLAKYPICWDTVGAAGAIDKIEVYDYLGSTLLESTSGHGQLLTLLQDLSTDSAELRTHGNVTGGTFSAGPSNAPARTTTDGPLLDLSTYDLSPVSGAPINDSGTVTDTTREYAIPLFSFLGLLSTKYAPLHNGFTIQITLNPLNIATGQTCLKSALTVAAQNAAVGSDGASTATNQNCIVRDVYLCAQVLELGGEAEGLLQQSTGGQAYIVPTKAFRNYVGAMDAGAASYRLDLNLNVASLTNILWIMRNNTYYPKIWARSLSDRVRNYLQSWYFQYGSSVLPQTSGIQCRSKNSVPQYGNNTTGDQYDHSEAYLELLKARHAFNQPHHDLLINTNSYTQDEPFTNCALAVRGTQTTSKFAAGLDLELVSGRSNDMVCGMNTNGMNTSIYANFDPTKTGSIKAVRIDAWCEYDAFINVQPGVASTVSF